jgi:hypothetical protein
MNIFVLDTDPISAAKQQCDKHVVKMPLECAQMLCTAIVLNGGHARYKPTHKNHPCTVWTRDSRQHFDWLVEHGLGLCWEYTARYGKIHACQEVIEATRLQRSCIEDNGWSTQPQCMPDQYKTDDVVQAYRDFYIGEKGFAKWKRNQPTWWREPSCSI